MAHLRRLRDAHGLGLRFSVGFTLGAVQAFATDTSAWQLAHVQTRHRAHACVEDRIQ